MFKTPNTIRASHDRKFLVVIGNGFDLDLNLKTGYRDFMESSTFERFRMKSYAENTSCAQLNLFDYLQERFDGHDKKWIDIEIELRDFARDINLSNYENNKEAIEYIRNSFNQVRAALCEHLTKIDYSSINIQSTAINVLKAIRRIRNCMVYNFNYTDISLLYKYIGGFPSFTVHNIHGTLKGKSIVLGFEDIPLHYADLDFMIKYQSDSYKTSEKADIRKDIEDAEEVLIFGHTLGCTDHPYFQRFFQREVDLVRAKRIPINIVTFDATSRRLINREINSMTNGEANLLNINYIQTHGNNSDEDIHDFLDKLEARLTPIHIPSYQRVSFF